MKFKNAVSLLTITVAGLFAGGNAAAQQSAPAIPTQAEITKMVELKAYRPAIKAIAQVWQKSTTTRPNDYDRYTLLMLRVECMIQLKDGGTALMLAKQATEAAGTMQEDEAARAIWVLLRNGGPGLTFVPKTGDKTPLDLTDPAARKKAIGLLFEQQMGPLGVKVAAAEKSQVLPPILALLPQFRDAHALEEIATGADEKTTAMIQPLGQQAHDLIDAELNRVNEKVLAVQRAASRQVAYGGGSVITTNGISNWEPAAGTSGLTSGDRQLLRDAIDYLGQIQDTTDNLAAIAQHYDKESSKWQALSKRARELRDLSSAIYDHE